MPKHYINFFVCLLMGSILFAQSDTLNIKVNNLKEVILNSNRIDLPLSEHSRTIQVILSTEIQKIGASNVVALLQQISGIDIRQRGVEGMQADLYIRGGSFDQTLLLIDGIKLEDAQTGHHTLNLLPPIDLIERIEILKGPAARIYGQNAFTGAINIVTKNSFKEGNQLSIQGGSYGQYSGQALLQKQGENKGIAGFFSYNTSDGYRYNTDFENKSYFIKSRFRTNKLPIQFLGYFSERKFGSNGFYATPTAKDQYEETQGSLIAFSSIIKKEKAILKVRTSWRRSQDMYVYIRSNPSVYRNFHINNKVGIALDYSIYSNWGTTGLGLDLAYTDISSNNLGEHNRVTTTIFAEHRLLLLNNKIDITPGVSLSNYSDFGAYFFPGIELGASLTPSLRVYCNIGTTYRIPTYTDLYYSDRTTLGNAKLKPENAIATEFGIRYTGETFTFSTNYFNRNSKDLIDYVKNLEEDLWTANNIQRVVTTGLELDTQYKYRFKENPQSIQLGYTYIDDNIKGVANYNFSRYSINSLKHHLTLRSINQWSKSISSSIALKYAKRAQDNPYTVLDLSTQWLISTKFKITLRLNNIFDEKYSETNLVPMPGANGNLGLQLYL